MSDSKRFKAMTFIHLCVILITIILPFCYGSINSHSSSNFGYRTQSKGVLDTSVCSITETCEPILKNTTCFGTTLPYSYTSLALVDDSSNQFEVQDNLALLEGLKSVPRCWAVVQPLLCSLYMPKCENGSVSLPSYEMCRITRGPCRFVETIGWPSFLHCENKKLFPPRCRNPLQEIKFNTTSKCIAPLIETDKPENWFHEVEGCGIQCQDPFFTKEEHEYYHYLTSILCTISFCTTSFTVLTFMINWKPSNRYPNVSIFYINLGLAFAYFGWLIQFFPNARKNLVCNEDGTIRRQHPRAGEHLCTSTFLLIYFPLMTSVFWFVIQSYTFHVTLRAGCPKDFKKKASYFHITAFSIPVVLSVAILAMKKVDCDSMSGICFVGYDNFYARLAFVLAPVSTAVVIADYFLISILYFLVKVRLNSEEFTNMQARRKLRQIILKIGILATVPTFLVISVIGCNIYEYLHKEDWSDSLRDYIVCLAMYSSQPYSNMDELHGTKCMLKSKPSVGVLHFQLVCLCLFGVISSVSIFNRTTVEAWKGFFYRRCCFPAERNANTLKKHEVISKAFQRRHQLNQGHLSFSHSTHDDPVGMNLDLNSIASNDISSSWAMALPHFINRRNAVAGIAHFPSRHYSSASDISRQMSVDSYNQQNLDSLSMQLSEQEFAHHMRHQKRKTRKEREKFLRANLRAPWCPGNRRGSDTSLQSSLVTASIAAALGAKVTKSTSTGDLGVQGSIPGTAIGTPMIPLPAKRKTAAREKVIPPFMHGMDGTHGVLDCQNVGSSLGSVSQRFTPGGFQNIMGGIIRPPMYGYDMMNIPFGYIGNGMYPAMYPGYPAADFNYATYNVAPYVTFGTQQSADAVYQYQHNLIPMQPRVESASESEYLPIIMSDSEYTDTGHRSYDEAQLMSACLMQQERLHAQAMAAATSDLSSQQPKPMLEPQECAKTQFLKRMNVLNAKDKGSGPSRPPSGKKSPHSEAPPPSPADSLKSLEIGDDDVFEEESLLQGNAEEQHAEGEDASPSQTLKPNFRRATSLSKTCQAQPETLGIVSKKNSSSLGQLPTKRCTPPKSVLKEKCLNAAESECLLSAKDDKENISR